MREEKLMDYLRLACQGHKNAAGSGELERTLGCSVNELRKQVNRLRRKSIPIGSSQDGYFYALTAGEIYSTIRQLQKMTAGLEAAIHGLEKALEDCGTAACPPREGGGCP